MGRIVDVIVVKKASLLLEINSTERSQNSAAELQASQQLTQANPKKIGLPIDAYYERGGICGQISESIIDPFYLYG